MASGHARNLDADIEENATETVEIIRAPRFRWNTLIGWSPTPSSPLVGRFNAPVRVLASTAGRGADRTRRRTRMRRTCPKKLCFNQRRSARLRPATHCSPEAVVSLRNRPRAPPRGKTNGTRRRWFTGRRRTPGTTTIDSVRCSRRIGEQTPPSVSFPPKALSVDLLPQPTFVHQALGAVIEKCSNERTAQVTDGRSADCSPTNYESG